MENLEGYLASAPVSPDVAVEEDPARHTPRPVPVPYKLSHRLGSERRTAIVQYYCEGHSSRETARRFEVGKTAVLEILRESGVTPRPPHRKDIKRIEAGGNGS